MGQPASQRDKMLSLPKVWRASSTNNHSLSSCASALKLGLPPRNNPPRSATATRLTYHLYLLPEHSQRLIQAARHQGILNTRRNPNSIHEGANPIMGIVTGLARAPPDAPSSMMHGAASVSLHISPLSVITPVQQFSFQQAEGARGVFRSADVGC